MISVISVNMEELKVDHGDDNDDNDGDSDGDGDDGDDDGLCHRWC